ncbi:glycosyltransferase family 4 protein [Micromonospora orduensis]|uniref:Glycosyltransferase family 4 protein n=1 Tax=Micromonospora orduensis TaxID=1420891 RepID=A0A5C4QQT6_9ACTN|nr:glycosyltransferase [Micromonospora orduensis]TNH27617.1 glycosyltransferase family 4 protein [Micromonospora orduensis]
MTDRRSPRVTLLGFTVPDDVLAEIIARDTIMPTQTHTFAWALVRALRAAGCPVHLLSAAPVSTWPDNRQVRFRPGAFRQDDVDGHLLAFVNLLGLKHLTRFVAAWRTGSRELREQATDVLLVHGVHSPFLWFGVLRARRRGVRVVPVLTDPPGVALPTDGRLVRLLRGLDVTLVRAALARCSGVIALTPALADDFAPGRPRLVMEGICAAEPASVDEAPPTATRDIVYAGGLSRAYGVDRLVEAFRGLPGDDLRLCVYGRGELEGWLRDQAAVDRRIAPPELLPRAELLPRLSRASVLVNPRPVDQDFVRWSFPSKIIEYLATGVPVVSTRLPGIPAGYDPWLSFAEPDTVEGLRTALGQVLSLPPEVARARGVGAARFVSETRGPAAQGRRMHDFLAHLCGLGVGADERAFAPDRVG